MKEELIITEHEHFRLRVGDVIGVLEGNATVIRVNASAATCVIGIKKTRTIENRFDESKTRTFETVVENTFRISPNSESPIYERDGKPTAAGIAADYKTPKVKPDVVVHTKSPLAPGQAEEILKAIRHRTSTKPGKCAFMDKLLEEGKWTRKEILAKTLAEFGGDPIGTERTMHSRPASMRKAGRVGKFAEEKV